MKFKFIKEVEGTVNNYDGTQIATGDITDLSELMSQKALRNPHYKVVGDATVTVNSIEKPVLKAVKKIMSPEHKAKMAEGRAKAKLRKANGNEV